MNPASEQFHQRAAAFVRANPAMAHVVRKGQDDESVRAWFTYFQTRGQIGTIALFRQLLSEKRPVQFPCRLPEHFDPSYEQPRHSWRDADEGPISRGDVSAVVAETVAELKKAIVKGRPPVPKEHLREPVKSPDEWLSDYKANPPPIPVFSDEFRAKLRLPYRDEAVE